MKIRQPRTAGLFLLSCSFLLLVFSPAKPRFSIGHFYAFICCFLLGFLLTAGYIGPHPVAAELRRQAKKVGIRRLGPLCAIADSRFRYADSAMKRWLVVTICAAAALLSSGVGIFLMSVYSSNRLEASIAGGFPLMTGLLIFWILIRYPGICILVTPQTITLKGYLRTVTIPWQDIVALVTGEHFVLTPNGFTPTGMLYTVYSARQKLWFSASLEESRRLAALIELATGLKWVRFD